MVSPQELAQGLQSAEADNKSRKGIIVSVYFMGRPPAWWPFWSQSSSGRWPLFLFVAAQDQARSVDNKNIMCASVNIWRVSHWVNDQLFLWRREWCFSEVTLEIILRCHNFKSRETGVEVEVCWGSCWQLLTVQVKFPYVESFSSTAPE